jgi:tetratricopeptide (TPR) repeat protein
MTVIGLIMLGFLFYDFIIVGGYQSQLLAKVNPIISILGDSSYKADEVQATALIILKNSEFVLQFVSWIFTIGAVIFTALTFFGVSRVLSLRETEEKINKKILELESKNIEFEKSREVLNKFEQAKIFYVQGVTYEGAYDSAWEILETLPDTYSYEVCLYKGLVSKRRGDFSDAVRFFEKSLDIKDADKVRTFYNIGKCWLDKGSYNNAIGYFDKAIALRSGYGDAHIEKAMAYRRSNDLKKAIQILDDYLKLDKDNPRGHYNIACYYCLNGNKDKAYENLERAISLNTLRYKKLAGQDDDFVNIQGESRFKELLKNK